jgi:hypothetical protein
LIKAIIDRKKDKKKLAKEALLKHDFCVMKNTYFKGFHHLFGRAKKSAERTLKERADEIRARAPGQLHTLFAAVVEPEKIQGRAGSRERIYTADVTFWGMLGQVFRDGSLRDAVREIQASICAIEPAQDPGENTGSYSTARQRLPQGSVDEVLRRVWAKLTPSESFLGGRRIMVVDGTSVQLEDTLENQREYPQPTTQKPGCGFPMMQIVALLNLTSTALERLSFSPHNADEGGMFDTELAEHLQHGDVLLADRLFGSYQRIATLHARGVDVLTRLHQARSWPKDARGDDVVVQWRRPPLCDMPDHISDAQWAALPETLQVRYVRYRVDIPGFRSRLIMLATTLLDTPVEELIEVYQRRWDIELSFDDIKTTMGMDFIRAKSPAMAVKVATIYAIAYNLVRWLQQQALLGTSGLTAGIGPARLSFKGTLDAALRFAAEMTQSARNLWHVLRNKLFLTIVRDRLPVRDPRFEPRVKKRRPKPYGLMTQPRAVLKHIILSNHAALLPSICALSK